MTKRYVSPPNWPAPPPNWTPPAGWKPDPRWGPAPKDWVFWRENESWFGRHKLLTGLGGGGLGLLLIVGAVGSAGTSSVKDAAESSTTSYSSPPVVSSAATPPNVTSSTPSPPKAASPAAPTEPPSTDPPSSDSEYGNYPSSEKEFVSIVAKAQDDAAEADNDLQRGAALSKRDTRLCKVVGSGKVHDWVGKISGLESNSDGFGVLTIDIADDNAVATWNNALSDFQDNTLIKPGKLLDALTSMEEGQKVKFNGRFINTNGCVNDSRLTKTGKLNDPEFVFKFSSVEPI